jgi:hypothetical protein
MHWHKQSTPPKHVALWHLLCYIVFANVRWLLYAGQVLWKRFVRLWRTLVETAFNDDKDNCNTCSGCD